MPSAAKEPSGTPVPEIRVGASLVLTSTPTRFILTCGYFWLNEGTRVLKTLSTSSSLNQRVASPLAVLALGAAPRDLEELEPPGAQAVRPAPATAPTPSSLKMLRREISRADMSNALIVVSFDLS